MSTALQKNQHLLEDSSKDHYFRLLLFEGFHSSMISENAKFIMKEGNHRSIHLVLHLLQSYSDKL